MNDPQRQVEKNTPVLSWSQIGSFNLSSNLAQWTNHHPQKKTIARINPKIHIYQITSNYKSLKMLCKSLAKFSDPFKYVIKMVTYRIET